MEKKDDLELKNLEQFIGTTQYYNVLNANVTDGIKYIMDNGYSWFVTDALIVIKMKLKTEPFLTVKLLLNETKKDTATMEISDGNDNVFYTQIYSFTDAKRDLTLFYTDNVLMLSNEY